MKVFVPMSDELLDSPEKVGRLVPFNPDFLEHNARPGTKPANWISETDYTAACRRLQQCQEEAETA